MAWLQIRGDSQIRRFLFDQHRVESLFDKHIDQLHCLVHELLVHKDVFHVKIHYSSNQLTVWKYTDPFMYEVYVGDQVCCNHKFISNFASNHIPDSAIEEQEIFNILDEFKRLRLNDQQIYLRNASIHILNGKVGMTFSCDGSHYIDHTKFFDVVKTLTAR